MAWFNNRQQSQNGQNGQNNNSQQYNPSQRNSNQATMSNQRNNNNRQQNNGVYNNRGRQNQAGNPQQNQNQMSRLTQAQIQNQILNQNQIQNQMQNQGQGQMQNQGQGQMQNQGQGQMQNQNQGQMQNQNQNQGQKHNKFNEPLPDGVRLQPLDEKTFSELQKSIASAEKNPSAAPVENIATAPSSMLFSDIKPAENFVSSDRKNDFDHVGKLEEFIQNERNSALFYEYLSRVAEKEHQRNTLKGITTESRIRNKKLNQIYEKIKGSSFEIKESDIDNTVRFRDGILWAIREENKSLKELSALYQNSDDAAICKTLNALMYNKVSDLSSLHLIAAQ